MVGLSYLLGFGSEQPGHGSMAGSRSFANGGTVDVAWQGPYRWVGRPWWVGWWVWACVA